jgi:hypothetical protein
LNLNKFRSSHILSLGHREHWRGVLHPSVSGGRLIAFLLSSYLHLDVFEEFSDRVIRMICLFSDLLLQNIRSLSTGLDALRTHRSRSGNSLNLGSLRLLNGFSVSLKHMLFLLRARQENRVTECRWLVNSGVHVDYSLRKVET